MNICIQTIHRMIPDNYDYDHAMIQNKATVDEILALAVKATDLEVKTKADGSKHFMMRCPGFYRFGPDDSFTMDDIADFVLTSEHTIKNLFIGSDCSDESDWIFIDKYCEAAA